MTNLTTWLIGIVVLGLLSACMIRTESSIEIYRACSDPALEKQQKCEAETKPQPTTNP